MKKIVAFCVAFCTIQFLSAQKPSEVFDYYRDSLPNQHIYIQFDKQAYVAGDTAWFKGYVYSNYAPSFLSTNFFIDLTDERGNVIDRKRYPIFDGTAIGNFDLPSNLRQGMYVVRAYTAWTTNFDQSFVFKKAIPVFNPTSLQPSRSNPQYLFEIFPEGGKLINGLPNNIAYRATDNRMQTVAVRADLVDSKGNKIGNIANGKESEGVFSFTPSVKEKYFVNVVFPDQTKTRSDFPIGVDQGIVLTVADEENGKSFSAITTPGFIKNGESLELIAVIDNHVVLDTKVPVNNNEALGLIATKNLHPGVMHIFLFDNQNKLLAQRATLIKNQKLSLPVELKVDELGRTSKAKNTFSFSFPETITGSFSVSVTDADKDLLPTSNEEIYSSILTASGTTKYLSNADPASETDADVMSISNKWYGDDWQKLTKKNNPLYLNDKYISLFGRATTEDGNATVVDGNMNIVLQPKNLMQKNFTVSLGSTGKFNLDSLIFEDSAKIFYELIANKKNKKGIGIGLDLNEPKIDFSSTLNGIDYSFIKAKESVFEDAKTLQLAAAIQKGLTVPLLTPSQTKPKKDKRSEKSDVEKRYTTGIFQSSTAKSFDFINNPPAHGGVNVFEYLQGQVGGLIIEKVNTGYNLWNSRSVSFNEVLRGNTRGLVPGKAFLNETETSTDVIMRIPINQIALVKYYEPGSIQIPGVGASSILAFWTKKPEDMIEKISNDMPFVMQNGYSVARNFYSPDYSTSSKNIADNRTTLYWEPNITVNEGKQFTINFYSSDSVKRYHVVVEGFTSDGKLVHLDKIIDLAKGF